MATDTDIAKGLAIGVLTSTGMSNPITEVGKQRQRVYSWVKAAADGAAATTTAETTAGQSLFVQGRIRAIYYTPEAALTADANNYATVTVSGYTAAGASKVSLATLTTTIASSGNLTKWSRKAFVLTNANVDREAGSVLTFEIAKAGTGVVVPAGTFTVVVEDT